MKNKFKLFSITVLAAVIALSMISCGGSGAGSHDEESSADPTSAVYEGNDGDNAYKLVITKDSNRAAYTPQNGDSYVLTINITQTSEGTITVNGNVFTLTPNGSTTTFTVTVSGAGITDINGTITLRDGTTLTAPGSLTPVNNSDNESGTQPGGASGRWRTKKIISYSVKDGVASYSSEVVFNYIFDRFTSNTNLEQKYTETITYTSGTSSTTSYHFIQNGQTYVTTFEAPDHTTTDTGTTDLATHLASTGKQVRTDNSGTTTTEYSYTIQLLSDSGGIKTYKRYMNTYIINNVSQDASALGYSEIKIQNGRRLEEKQFTADGVLRSTTIVTYLDNAVVSPNDKAIIFAKLGDFASISIRDSTHLMSASNTYTTFEVLSDSAAELGIRGKQFDDNVLVQQQDTYYEKVN